MSEAVHTISGGRLRFFPITLFATVMGLTGLAIAFLRFDHIMHTRTYAGGMLLFAVSVWFVFLTVMYSLKLYLYPDEVKEEFRHPVRMNFFPTVSISMLLLSIGYDGIYQPLSSALWHAGALVHISFTFVILNIWFFNDFRLQTKNPAWFIPVVGNILVPVAGVTHANAEISWFFFSVGIILWIVLFSIVFYRLIFHEQLMAKFLPTLFILIAPPAVGFLAYAKLTDGLDAFARVLYYFGLFTAFMLFSMFRHFKKVPFFVSWWAYTFPMDALTISTLLMYKLTGYVFFKVLSVVFITMTVAVVLTVVYKTAAAALKGQVCVPE
ncbi:MAG: SLAC1 anion channel family protein [Deferribacterales bacterium]